MITCRLCESPRAMPFLRFARAPATVERLLRAEQRDSDESIDLRIWRCPDCGFIQQEHSPLPPDYYRSYDKSAVHSPKMQAYQEGLAEELVRRFDLVGQRVLEAGCGDGYFASRLIRNGVAVTGVDPARPASAAARKRGVEVVEDYFNRTLPLPPEGFDAFVARQVVSHVENLNAFFEAVWTFLRPGGLGFLEAPDAAFALRGHRYYDFFADYVNYFTPHTLSQLLGRHGFEVMEATPRAGGEYTLLVFERPSTLPTVDEVENLATALRRIVEQELAAGRRLGCWGAGGRGISLLSLAELDSKSIDYVIDTAPEKQGLYLPGTRLPVVPPERLQEKPVDTIIITALMYEDEILDDLRYARDFGGRVVLLLPEPHVQEAVR